MSRRLGRPVEARAPPELVGAETAFSFLDETDPLRLPSPPEIMVDGQRPVSLPLYPFHQQEVFPELADVVPQSRGIEVGDQGVPDTRVKKVIFRLLGHFVAEVPAETAEGEDNKTLFEKIEIAPHGLVIQPDLLGQLAKGDLGADLESQEPSE